MEGITFTSIASIRAGGTVDVLGGRDRPRTDKPGRVRGGHDPTPAFTKSQTLTDYFRPVLKHLRFTDTPAPIHSTKTITMDALHGQTKKRQAPLESTSLISATSLQILLLRASSRVNPRPESLQSLYRSNPISAVLVTRTQPVGKPASCALLRLLHSAAATREWRCRGPGCCGSRPWGCGRTRHTNILRTTSPATSVRRKSRPMWR